LSPARFDWNDLGSWKSIYDFHRKDKDGNAVIHTDLYHENASRNLVKTNPNKKVVIAGLDNFIVVDTQDFLMICPMDKNQEVKEISSKATKKFNRGKT
jgi:mannose-1-phosphate guanylyltransferase